MKETAFQPWEKKQRLCEGDVCDIHDGHVMNTIFISRKDLKTETNKSAFNQRRI